MRDSLTNIKFIERAKLVHGNKYIYSASTYTDARHSVVILCPKHGLFTQRPFDHLNGCGCKKCVGLNRKTNDEFIIESKKIFGDLFSYDDTNYINSQTKVIVKCVQHGNFQVTPNNHLSKKQGCPICKESKGEKKIAQLLYDMKVQFIREKTFENCVRKKRKLPFDFYLPNHNLVIEYDGRHHFEIIDAFGGKNGFSETQENDKFKNNFLHDNNIKLLRIPYNQYDNIEKLLQNNIF
jgi:very-short-patch-repair endonuclease